MRKGQIKIIEQAKRNHFPVEFIEELSKEYHTLRLLNIMFDYFYDNRNRENHTEAVNEFFECLSLVGKITDKNIILLAILLRYSNKLSYVKKKQVIKFWNRYVGKPTDIYAVYVYAGGLVNNLPIWNVLYVAKICLTSELSNYYNHITYTRCLKYQFLKEDYILRKEESLLVYLLKENAWIEDDFINELEKLYDYSINNWKTENIISFISTYNGQSSCCFNSRYWEFIFNQLINENSLVKAINDYCMQNTDNTKKKGNKFYIRRWKDQEQRNKIKQALQLIDPITTKAETETISINISKSGWVTAKHNTYDDIKAYFNNGKICYYSEKKQTATQLVISPEGHIFTKTKSDKLIPASLKMIARLYNNTFLKELLDIIFSAQENPFIYDIVADIKEGCLLPISYNEALSFRNRSELIKAKYKTAEGIQINWNKLNLSLSYMIIASLPHVHDKKSKSILLLQKNTLLLNGVESIQTKKYKIRKFICNILTEQIVSPNEIAAYGGKEEFNMHDDIAQTIRDYVNMCMEEKAGIDLRIDNEHLLNKKHDEIMLLNYEKKTKIVKIPKDTKFKPVCKALPKEFEQIKSRKRLIKETAMQRHCVWTYADDITKDNSAIFSYMDNTGTYSETGKAERYTIEIRYNRYNKNKGFYINQIKSKYNTDCKREFWEYVQQFLDEANKKKAA